MRFTREIFKFSSYKPPSIHVLYGMYFKVSLYSSVCPVLKNNDLLYYRILLISRRNERTRFIFNCSTLLVSYYFVFLFLRSTQTTFTPSSTWTFTRTVFPYVWLRQGRRWRWLAWSLLGFSNSSKVRHARQKSLILSAPTKYVFSLIDYDGVPRFTIFVKDNVETVLDNSFRWWF